MGLDRAGGLGGAGDRDPRGGSRDLQAVAARRRSTARFGSSARSTPPRTSTTSTRASRPPARTSRTPPSRRPTTTSSEGVRKLATETGAGQWGSALALACRLFDLECEVFMVGVSYDQKPYRRAMIETWGATVHRSPSELTDAGRAQAEHCDREPRDRDLRGRGDGRQGRRHQLLARLGAEPRLPAPDGDRPGGDRSARAWPASTRTSSSAASAAARTSPASPTR